MRPWRLLRGRPLPSPTLLLLGILPLLGWSVGLEEAVQRRRAEVLAARGAYQLALADSRTMLAAQLGKVAGDSALVQNLNWKLAHSVKSALEGRLMRGAVDQLVVVDRSCGELGRATRFEKAVPVPCPPPAGTPAEGGAFWVGSDGAPVLGLVSPVAGVEGGGTLLLGTVALDDVWLGLHPDLMESFRSLGLRLEGHGAAAPALVSDRLFDRLLMSRIGRELENGDPFLWPCLAAAMILCLLALARERNARAQSLAALGEFLAWTRQLTPSGVFVLPGKILASATGVAKTDLDAAKQFVMHAVQLKADAAQAHAAKREALETQLIAREDELQKHRQRLSELAELDSLAVQLQRTTAAFLARMDGFHAGATSLTGLLTGELSAGAAALGGQLAHWREGIAERGARKFLRGLSETPGEREGETRLDQELQSLAALAAGVAKDATLAAERTAVLTEAASFAARIAGLWHGLALKTHEEQTCRSLLAPIGEAQALVTLEPGFKDLAFANPESDVPPVRLPELPKAIWVAALYHVYLAAAELVDGAKASIATRVRQDGERLMLVVQVNGVAGAAPLPQRGARLAYHLDISKAILAPFALSVSVLPALDGPYPIALTWNAGAPYRRQPMPAGQRSRSMIEIESTL